MADLALPDHYGVLGVPRDADEALIRSAYRSKARQWHPDVCKEPNAESMFKSISAAYEILIVPAKRSYYDAELRFAEAKKLPDDEIDNAMNAFDLDLVRPKKKKKKKKKSGPKTPPANVEIDELPDGFRDDSLGRLLR